MEECQFPGALEDERDLDGAWPIRVHPAQRVGEILNGVYREGSGREHKVFHWTRRRESAVDGNLRKRAFGVLDDVAAWDVVPLGVGPAARGAGVAVVDSLLDDEEHQVDALLVEEGLAACHLAGPHSVHHAVADAIAVHDDALDVALLDDDFEHFVEELLEGQHVAGLDDRSAQSAVVVERGVLWLARVLRGAEHALPGDLHVGVAEMQPLAVAAVVPRDEPTEIATGILEVAALARLRAAVGVDVVADVERTPLGDVGDIPGEVDVPERRAELGGDVLRDVVDVRPLRAGFAHLLIVDKLRHDAALAEGALEGGVCVLPFVAVAVLEGAEHQRAVAGGDVLLDVGRLDGRQAVGDEVSVVFVAVDVDRLAALLPDAADSLVNVHNLPRQGLRAGSPDEDQVLVALLVELDVHRLHGKVGVRAEGLGGPDELDAHWSHLLRRDRLKLGAADVEAVDT